MIRCEQLVIAVLLAASLLGCGSPSPTVNDQPFRDAIGQYLKTNNMALSIKEIKQGPTDAAELSAAMSHEQLGGPSVTWKFQFARQANGTWQVTRHED
jgi:hypothetical protein